MAQKKKEVFDVKLEDGSKIQLACVKPTIEHMNEAQAVYNKAFRQAIENKAFVKAKIADIMRDQGIWTDENQKDYDKLKEQLADAELKLAKGGIRFSEARKIAIDMRRYRIRIRNLINEKTTLESLTAEAQAEQAKFNCLVALCTVYNSTDEEHQAGDRVFSDTEDYLEKATTPIGQEAATHFGLMHYGLQTDFEKKLPENEFLLKYGFANEDLRLVNKEGKFVDVEGREIDEDGDYVDEQGRKVDEKGNLIDKDGHPLVEFTPFLED